jgi:excisionase family DNA binding protein
MELKMSAQTPNNFEPFLTLEEVAKMLRKSVKTIRRFISQGHLPSFKIGGIRHVLVSEVQKFIQRQIEKGTPSCKNS